MILISHRGNIDGPVLEEENKPTYIEDCIKKGYDCEIDVWYKDNQFFLGHDEPQFKFPFELIEKYSNKLWIHCKNIQAFEKFREVDRNGKVLNYFVHDQDDLAITSKGYIWSVKEVQNGIVVMPEVYKPNMEKAIGVCSDYIGNYG